MAFERFAAVVRSTWLEILKADFPPPRKAAAQWRQTDSIVWMGLTFEQSAFYAAHSFGRLVEADEFSRRGGGEDFDFLVKRLVKEDYPKVPLAPLEDALDELQDTLSADELEDIHEELVPLAGLAAVGLVALELKENRKLLPVKRHPRFSVTVSDDRESPAWPCEVPAVFERDGERRRAALAAMCEKEESRALFRTLLKAGDQDESPDFLDTLVRARAHARR